MEQQHKFNLFQEETAQIVPGLHTCTNDHLVRYASPQKTRGPQQVCNREVSFRGGEAWLLAKSLCAQILFVPPFRVVHANDDLLVFLVLEQHAEGTVDLQPLLAYIL